MHDGVQDSLVVLLSHIAGVLLCLIVLHTDRMVKWQFVLFDDVLGDGHHFFFGEATIVRLVGFLVGVVPTTIDAESCQIDETYLTGVGGLFESDDRHVDFLKILLMCGWIVVDVHYNPLHLTHAVNA